MGQIDAINCDKNDMGLGLVGCQPFFKELKAVILVKKGWKMTKTAFEAMEEADYIELIQKGIWIPIIGSKGFTQNTPETTTEEYSGGVMSAVRNGKPLIQLDYNKGLAHHAALYNLNSFQEYDVLLVDDNNTILMARSADNVYRRGMSASMVNTATYSFLNGDTSANTSLTIQLDNEEQFNRLMSIYTSEQSGVEPLSLPAIANVGITFTATAGDPITVFVSSGQNVSYGVAGLTAGDFRIIDTATNSVLAISTVADGVSDGYYTITPTAALTEGQTIKIQTYDATASVNVALRDTDNALFKGESAVVTVAA